MGMESDPIIDWTRPVKMFGGRHARPQVRDTRIAGNIGGRIMKMMGKKMGKEVEELRHIPIRLD